MPRALQVVMRSDAAGARAAPLRLSPGRIVPGTRYEIVRWLGEGGMGVIYEARHVDVERRVALKVIREDRCHGDAAEKFRREARTASRIGSDFIVEVFDVGELPDGRTFIALEMVDGHDLFEELGSAPMPLGRLIAILRQVTKGLAAAHSAGVTHRDIKAENVLIGPRNGREDAVKIVDFGISRVHGAARGEGRTAGTPAYMAPERWVSNELEGPGVDIYAVGCLAFELLAGRPPFEGTSEQIMVAHLEQDVPPLERVRPGLRVPADLEAVIRRCLAKTAPERYASMPDLEAALCEVQIAAGVETAWDDLPLPDVDAETRDSLLRRMPHPDVVHVRRPSAVWLVGIAVALVLAFGLGAWGVGRMRSDDGLGEVDAHLDALANRARDAAAKAYWVVPPADGEETAYRWVLALEAEGSRAAQARGEALRTEFATTLTRLGDRYWDREGGRVFAVDFYAQALVFWPEVEHARARAPLTPGELAVLRDKAASLDFSADERNAFTPLVLLAAADEEVALEALESYFRADEARSFTQRERIEAFLRASGRDLGRSAAAADSASGSDTDVELGEAPPMPEESRRLTQQAARHAERGRRSQAEALYHQALAMDRNNSEAMIGLSNLYFERAEYYKAMDFAARGVRLRPRDAKYRIILGDAYFRLLRYNDAKQQYQWGQRLGHPQAKGRLNKVARKLGDAR